MRIPRWHVAAALSLFGGIGAAVAQDVEHGSRLAERWCSQCHATGPAPGKSSQLPSFASIAARPGITSDMIAAFLLLPHATMPNPPLSGQDARDIAAFIMAMRK